MARSGVLQIGSPGWTRTSDILINSQALYRLSYRGIADLQVTRLILPRFELTVC